MEEHAWTRNKQEHMDVIEKKCLSFDVIVFIVLSPETYSVFPGH